MVPSPVQPPQPDPDLPWVQGRAERPALEPSPNWCRSSGVATLPCLSFPTRKGQILKAGGKHREELQRGAGTPTTAVTGMGEPGCPGPLLGMHGQEEGGPGRRCQVCRRGLRALLLFWEEEAASVFSRTSCRDPHPPQSPGPGSATRLSGCLKLSAHVNPGEVCRGGDFAAAEAKPR